MKKFMGDFGTVFNDIDLSVFGTRTGELVKPTLRLTPMVNLLDTTSTIVGIKPIAGDISADDTLLRLITDVEEVKRTGDFINTNEIKPAITDINEFADLRTLINKDQNIMIKPSIQTMVNAMDSEIDMENIVGESPNGNIVVATINNGVLNTREIETDTSKVFKGKVKKGQKNKMVKIVKKYLQNKNLFLGTIDENFGAELVQVLREFQLSRGIEVSGEIDADTFNIVVGADAELANANKLTQLNQAKKSKNNKMAMGVAGLALLFFSSKG